MAASPRQAQALTFSAGSQGTTPQKQFTEGLDARTKQGDKDAAFQLGVAHTRGYFGLRVDLPKAKSYFKIALEEKDEPTNAELTVIMAAEKFCFDHRNILGEELITEDVDGTKELKKGSYEALHYIPSKFLFADATYNGNVTDALKQHIASSNEAGAKARIGVAKATQACSEAGFTPATGFLGRLYCEAYGVDENINEGLRLLKQAANAGDAQSSLYLGTIYHKGLHGVGINLQDAHKWYSEASKQGVPEAQTGLEKGAKLKKTAKCVLL